MREILRRRRIRDVDDREAVLLDLAGLRIQRLASVMADEQDPPLAVRVHDRLVRGARLKIVVPDEPQVDGILRARDSGHESGADGH